MKPRTIKGFSLVEVIVASFLCALLMLAMSGSFVSFLKLNRTIKSKNVVDENVRFILNVLDKELRTASAVTTPSGNISSIDNLKFTNQEGIEITYAYSNNNITKTSGTNTVNITNGAIYIKGLKFNVAGNVTDDNIPTVVTTSIQATINATDTASGSTIQETSVLRNK